MANKISLNIATIARTRTMRKSPEPKAKSKINSQVAGFKNTNFFCWVDDYCMKPYQQDMRDKS
jgi:hypothetical protein